MLTTIIDLHDHFSPHDFSWPIETVHFVLKAGLHQVRWHTWAQRPTPPLNLLKGTHSTWLATFFRYETARRRCMCLMLCAVSRVFCELKVTYDYYDLYSLFIKMFSSFKLCVWMSYIWVLILKHSKWGIVCSQIFLITFNVERTLKCTRRWEPFL